MTDQPRALSPAEFMTKQDVADHFLSMGHRFALRRIAEAMRAGDHHVANRVLLVDQDRLRDIFDRLTKVEVKPCPSKSGPVKSRPARRSIILQAHT